MFNIFSKWTVFKASILCTCHICVHPQQLHLPLAGPDLAVLEADLAADDGLVGDVQPEVGLGQHQVREARAGQVAVVHLEINGDRVLLFLLGIPDIMENYNEKVVCEKSLSIESFT